MIDFLNNFLLNHSFLWLIIIFFALIITNIFPVMFFVLPDIFIYLWLFLVKNGQIWYIPYLVIVFWAIIWEWINYFIWYKFWKKLLKESYMENEKIKKWIEKIRKNPIKNIAIWKLIPGIIWLIPLLAGFLKIDFIKFFIVNSIMVFVSIAIVFLWYFGVLSILEKYFWYKIWILFAVILFVFRHLFWCSN